MHKSGNLPVVLIFGLAPACQGNGLWSVLFLLAGRTRTRNGSTLLVKKDERPRFSAPSSRKVGVAPVPGQRQRFATAELVNVSENRR
jgi:ABC-type uncharacterized transport system ATPase subunit